MAVATDSNPGTSPTTSPLLMLNMACTLFRLTPQEALAGMTHVAARALGLRDRGKLRAGLRADVAVYAIDEPAELAWRFGAQPVPRDAPRRRAALRGARDEALRARIAAIRRWSSTCRTRERTCPTRSPRA